MVDVEILTKKIGRELYDLVQKETRPFVKTYWWKEKAMMWFMKDPGLRTQMLRFVDVFPVLKTTKEKNEHFVEYFVKGLENSPLLFEIAEVLSKVPGGAKTVAFFIQKAVEMVANHFIVGDKAKDISKAIKKLKKEKAGYTLGLLGEAVISELEAEMYMNRYLEVIKILQDLGYPVDLSLKLSSLYSQFDPINFEESIEIVKKRLRKILQAIKQADGTLTIDMENYYYHELILKIFMEIFDEKEFEDFKIPGIAIQTYLSNWEKTLKRIINWATNRKRPVKVRLVKGAYWDTEVILARQKGWICPVYLYKWETDLSFEKAIPQLLESKNIILAPGTHNIRSLARVMAEVEIKNISKKKIENQFLWGMGDPLMKASISMGYPTVIYVPCGDILLGMGYLVRRMIENTAQAGFLFQSLGLNVSIEDLLKNPEERRN